MIYFIQGDITKRIKIGYTNVSVGSRIATLQTGSPDYLHFLGSCPGNKKLETTLHKKFKKLRLFGEWFEDSPRIHSFIKNKCVPTEQETSWIQVLLMEGVITLEKAINLPPKKLAIMGREYEAYLISRIQF